MGDVSKIQEISGQVYEHNNAVKSRFSLYHSATAFPINYQVSWSIQNATTGRVRV